MSDRLITAEEARERLAELESMSDWTGEDRIAAEYAYTVVTLKAFADSLLTTIEQKSARIKRLQAEIEEFDTAPVVSTEEERKILNELGYTTAEDMVEK